MGEKEIIRLLKKSKNVLLIEPPYRRSYVPLGLAKIASFVKSNNGEVAFARGALPGKFDLICITSVFTTDANIVIKTIRDCQRSMFLKNTLIIVGGIFASLMPEMIKENTGIDSFQGYSKILDKCIPDYSIDWQVKAPWDSFSTAFTQRGCTNHCGYCMVHKLEPEIWVNPKWKKCIVNEKPNVAVSDNNLLACSDKHWREVLKYLAEIQKGVLFNNGIYSKLITDESAELLSKIKYTKFGLRLAFDRMNEDGHYQRGVEKLIKAGCNLKKDSLSYVLFNFTDTPQEAYYRVRECWKYKSTPYGMQYRPLSSIKKSDYIGKYWTTNLLLAFKNYCEIYGFNRGDRTFETWTKNGKIKLTEEDWEKWYYVRP